ncbi:hypothetical protein NEOLEDRAFT_1130304 [Neolentinus lepideus HHB14362 ss-1]|uniref:NB-ARC domain-containing protein n=1 Tax=Neolentinus lepideus HHB14362 ss-1 TaxID=1314782 RepID=A0A165U923_9AGAM|nr:hypothetical protein NEOLEDRAFT_1130304 [Neolentinus lepideus HHB14362 ss-1]
MHAGQVVIRGKLDGLTVQRMDTNLQGIHDIIVGDQCPAMMKGSIFPSRTPPPKSSIFYGRDQEIADAVTLLTSGSDSQPNLAILGSGGMGKTTCALAILHHPIAKHILGNSPTLSPVNQLAMLTN